VLPVVAHGACFSAPGAILHRVNRRSKINVPQWGGVKGLIGGRLCYR